MEDVDVQKEHQHEDADADAKHPIGKQRAPHPDLDRLLALPPYGTVAVLPQRSFHRRLVDSWIHSSL